MFRKTLAALAAVALSATSAFAADLKVGFVYVGPIGDHGWTYQHDQGRLAVEAHFGDKVETTFVESVAEGPDAERVIRQLAASGHGLIFTTSFGYMDPTIKIAKMFPDVKFEHATGYKRADNVSTYSGRFYEGRTVAGVIAGKMTKTNKIGYIASFPIPEVVRGINATALAAQSVNPDAEVSVVWVSTWYDPGKEADAAKALMAAGADIIMQHTDSPAALQAAENADGVLAFGQASDMIKFAPNAQLTAIEDNWAPYYIKRVQAVLDGTWTSEDSWKGLADNEVVMAPYWNMPYEVANMAKEVEADVRMGTRHPFTGPIVDRDGVERVAAGAVADDGMLLGMDFFVKGVSGDLPK
ncbi:MAG: BMP family ABC transporter substrate-binding protein [Pseudomonadota bacterium]